MANPSAARWVCATLSLLTLGLPPALAQQGSAPPQATACQACHGVDGRSIAADIPHLAGQRVAYLSSQLKAFRDGTRKNELMNAVAAQLRDEDVAALAAYWNGVSAPAAAASAPLPPHPARVSAMAFPADFPKGFREYRRESDGDSKTVGISYANTVAFQAARDGQPLPDGLVVMVVNHAAKTDAAGQVQADGRGGLEPGAVQSYSGMAAGAGWGDAMPALLRNGNWQYGLFNAKGEPRIRDLQPRCLACHQPQAAQSFVFTLPALRKAALEAMR
jgi:cytochrome c553